MKQTEEKVVALLQKLISHDTTNPCGNEAPLAIYLGELLKEHGFGVQMVPLKEKGRASIVATYGKGEGKTLGLTGHLDVVPASTLWKTPPFEGTIKDEKIYGRGAADMKGGVAAMVIAAIEAVQQNKTVSGKLVLAFVADEELYNRGTHGVLQVEAVAKADYMLIGEPTQMELHIAHKGTARYTIEVKGKSCHSSGPQNGVNAIEKMGKVLLAITKRNEELQKISHLILPSPTIAAVMIEGGEKDNIIPNRCCIQVDRRILPHETKEAITQELTEMLEELKKDDRDFSYILENYIFLGAGEMAEESDIVSLAKQVYAKTFGKEAVVSQFPATCEQVLFRNKEIATIVVGPGSIAQAHIVDEFVGISQLTKAVAFYKEMIEQIAR